MKQYLHVWQRQRLAFRCSNSQQNSRSVGPALAIISFVGVLFATSSVSAQARYTDAQEQEFHERATRSLAHGQVADAEALAGTRAQDDPSAAALRAQILAVHGHYREIEELLTPIAQDNPSTGAGLELGMLLVTLGRTAEALPYLDAVIDMGARSRSVLDQYRGGLAARVLGGYREANTFLRGAALLSPTDPSIQTTWGELFLDKYNYADALKSFEEALNLDDEWAPAHLGLARVLADENPSLARASAERALEIDPSMATVHLFIAGQELDDRNRDAARGAIDRALEINPRNLEARALLGAIAYLEDRTDDFDAEVKRALEINPFYGEIYRIAGSHAAGAYRFPEAVTLVRRALELDPTNTRSYADLGLHLLRTGDESGARTALERSFAEDPFDVVTFNLLGMMDTLDEFQTFERGDLIVRLHPDEAPVLREYVLTLAQEAIDTLSARYEMTVRGPVLVEVFPRHDDFAVRNLGLPGMIGALGACFGQVVTMDSPRARPPGDFNWQSTLWHEIAHVVTLQMSNQRLPRWLSEGISTYEQKRAHPAWARDQDMEFASALNDDRVLSLRDLNSGFSRPETISLAYFQASVLVEHLIDVHGEPALRELLHAYGDGLETEAALARIGLDFDRLQASFDEALETKFRALRRAMTAVEMSDNSGGPDGLDAMRRLADDNPGSFRVQLTVGRALYEAGEAIEALGHLERAAELVPMATGLGSPHGVMAQIAEEQGESERAMRELEQLLEHDDTSLDAARQLAALAEEAGDEVRLRFVYERVIQIDPFDPIPHQSLGRLALAAREYDVAALELRVALALGPVDRVGVYCDLAETLLAAGDLDGAKRQALAALELAPTYERAQELLLGIIEEQP